MRLPTLLCIGILLGTQLPIVRTQGVAHSQDHYRIVHVDFKSNDNHDMHGKLALPLAGKLKAIVLYVQTAEGMTVDMKRPLSRTMLLYRCLDRRPEGLFRHKPSPRWEFEKKGRMRAPPGAMRQAFARTSCSVLVAAIQIATPKAILLTKSARL